ncbi:MAG: glycosyltransferase family 2 protein [Melioribacteraceae bacterium]|nr:glycosyltransferase family 2 protein [Melioribacteraceae bacterium]MCF8353485.1 glycosyltransferase family 2 protein [Melioribacteraceae bacterium]MCF8392614.1 glycosyltransferase family 2 protein [Melioribacteraceae bacterium]MCF8418514.1 glycosyltransferase family 2 protein [Melioribacteraceae bacterium]
MSKQTPVISIVIPTYNSGKYILDTLNSVYNQTFKNYEIIIIDDGSTDSTIEIINKECGNHPGINFIRSKHCGRPSVLRNIGIKNALGNFIAFLDSDDLWTKTKLADQYNLIANNNSAALVYSVSVTFGNIGIASSNYEVLPVIGKAVKSRDDLINIGNSITCSTVLAKKDLLIEVGGFDEDPQNQMEDYTLWIALADKGKIIFVPKIHTYYRVHDQQFSGDWELKKKRLEYISTKYNLKLAQYKGIRNKGIVWRLLRNFLHFISYLYYKFLSQIK